MFALIYNVCCVSPRSVAVSGINLSY